MLTRLTPLLRAAPRIQHVRTMGGHHTPAHWKSVRQVCEDNKNHMNFMPVPEGSWQENFSKRNSQMNLMLAGGLVAFLATFSFLYKSGVMYLHTAPPMYNCKDK